MHTGPTSVLTDSHLEKECWDDLPRVTDGQTGEGLARMTQGAFLLLQRCGVVFQPSQAATPKLTGADTGLLALLFPLGFSGLALLAPRATGAVGTVLAIHLGLALALLVTLPCGKRVHALCRAGALIRHGTGHPAGR